MTTQREAMTETAALIVAGFEHRLSTKRQTLDALALLVRTTECLVDRCVARDICLAVGVSAAQVGRMPVDEDDLSI